MIRTGVRQARPSAHTVIESCALAKVYDGFPGYLRDSTSARVSALAKMCINMHVGELDTGWLEEMQDQAKQFRAKGYTVAFTVEKGQSHVIGSLTGEGAARLFDEIEKAKQGCGK